MSRIATPVTLAHDKWELGGEIGLNSCGDAYTVCIRALAGKANFREKTARPTFGEVTRKSGDMESKQPLSGCIGVLAIGKPSQTVILNMG